VSRQFISKIIALLAGIVLLTVAYSHNKSSSYVISGNAYGTNWIIKSPEYIADHHTDNIEKILSEIDYIASNYKEDSEIAIINNSTNTYHFISEDLFNILNIAKDVEKKSKGFYNIMLGKVSSNLGFSPTFNKELVHKKDDTYKLDEKNSSLEKISLNWFDLSSIAKGYAVQKIHEYLVNQNLNNHYIDIGGEIIINGINVNNPWIVGIQNPLSFKDNASTIIQSKNNFLAIATSGEYRNYKTGTNGEKVTHTINPNTLESVKHNILSVTVLHHNSATYADAYATAFNAMGPELAIDIANQYNIALMLIVQEAPAEEEAPEEETPAEENENNVNFIYSNKWYDLVI
jgi:thiamine biosynthesis lipoprotein